MMLRIGIIEDEIDDLISAIRNLLALDPAHYEFEIVPVLLSDPQLDTDYAIAERVREHGQMRLSQAGVNSRPWPAIIQKGMLCPADEQQRAEILRYLEARQVNLIICDAWLGKDSELQTKFSDVALKLAGVMLLDAAAQQDQWRGHCWVMTKYQPDVLAKLHELNGWKPERFDSLRYCLDKAQVIGTAPGECNKQLEWVIDECLTHISLSQPTELPTKVILDGRFESLVGRSQPMLKVYGKILKVAPRNSPVVILGESGSGKELVASAIHKHSPRAKGPFVPVDCGALQPNLIESELFGHVKGSFTGAMKDKAGLFEQARGGTIFLDEIGNLDLAMQAKLLRVLQEGKIRRVGGDRLITLDARVLAANNKDLKQEVLEGRFKDDLLYRLLVTEIQIPPLRERDEDVALLCEYFIGKHARPMNSFVTRIAAPALETLRRFSWPGNVRHLENVICDAIVEAGVNTVIELDNEAIIKIANLTREKPSSRHLILSAQNNTPLSSPTASGSLYGEMGTADILRLVMQKQVIKTLPQWAKTIGVPKTLELANLLIREFHSHLPNEEEAREYFNMSYSGWKGWVHRNQKEQEKNG